jgi:hypothetical protein
VGFPDYLRDHRIGLLFLVVGLSTNCVLLDTPVEPVILEEPLAAARGREKMPINDDGIRVELDVPAPMRDGVRLFADVYLPDAPGPFPVILTRMPYDKQSAYGMMPDRSQGGRSIPCSRSLREIGRSIPRSRSVGFTDSPLHECPLAPDGGQPSPRSMRDQ